MRRAEVAGAEHGHPGGGHRGKGSAPSPLTTMCDVNPGFDLYTLPEEHQLLRKTVRELADDKIAPRAAEIDEAAEFPWDVHDALVAAELHAVHVPEQYDGVGADAIASAIVIEEVARACAASSLIPAVNKLGTMGLLLSGGEELKADVPAEARARRGHVQLLPVRARGRQRRRRT